MDSTCPTTQHHAPQHRRVPAVCPTAVSRSRTIPPQLRREQDELKAQAQAAAAAAGKGEDGVAASSLGKRRSSSGAQDHDGACGGGEDRECVIGACTPEGRPIKPPLPCGCNRFCGPCIARYLHGQRCDNAPFTCPLCRAAVPLNRAREMWTAYLSREQMAQEEESAAAARLVHRREQVREDAALAHEVAGEQERRAASTGFTCPYCGKEITWASLEHLACGDKFCGPCIARGMWVVRGSVSECPLCDEEIPLAEALRLETRHLPAAEVKDRREREQKRKKEEADRQQRRRDRLAAEASGSGK